MCLTNMMIPQGAGFYDIVIENLLEKDILEFLLHAVDISGIKVKIKGDTRHFKK